MAENNFLIQIFYKFKFTSIIIITKDITNPMHNTIVRNTIFIFDFLSNCFNNVYANIVNRINDVIHLNTGLI